VKNDGEPFCMDNFYCPSGAGTEAECTAKSAACIWEETPCAPTVPCPTGPSTTPESCAQNPACFFGVN
jgi:hypothetical protein